MTITSAICNSFKQEILVGTHNFTASSGNTFKIALYSSDSATLSKSTTAYTAPSDGTADPTNTYEVTSTSSGYTTGGNSLTNVTPVLSGDTACCKFSDTSWGRAYLENQNEIADTMTFVFENGGIAADNEVLSDIINAH